MIMGEELTSKVTRCCRAVIFVCRSVSALVSVDG